MKQYLPAVVTAVVLVVLAGAVFMSTKHMWAMQSGEETACPPINALDYCTIDQPNGTLGTTVATFSPVEDVFVSGNDRNVIFWSTETGDRVLQKVITAGDVRTVAYTSDGGILAASGGSLIQVYDLPEGSIRLTISDHTDVISRTSISPDGNWLAASDEIELRVWNLSDGSLLHTLKTGRITIRDLHFSPDNAHLAVGRRGGVAEVYDVESGALLFTIPEENVFGLRYSHDGSEIITAGYSDQIKRWRADNGEFIGAIGGHGKNILAMGISLDGQFLVSGARDGIKVWDLANNSLIVILENTDLVSSISFSKDNQYLVVSGMSEQIRVWRLP